MPTTGNILSYDELRRSRNKARADRAFSRMYEDAPSSASSGPRPALYRAEMGHYQRRATRMQRGGAGQSYGAIYGGVGKTARMPDNKEPLLTRITGGISIRVLVAAAVIVVILVFVLSVYPAAQQYYLSVRQNAQIEAEAQAVAERTEDLASEIEYLKTDSGVEAAAREQLGWIKEGENAVEVYGLPASVSQKSTNADTVIASGSVPAPDTWYSPVLDVVFGYETNA